MTLLERLGPYSVTAETKTGDYLTYYPGTVEIRTIGPIVRVREITSTGIPGSWKTLAFSLDPVRYIRLFSNERDLVERRVQGI